MESQQGMSAVVSTVEEALKSGDDEGLINVAFDMETADPDDFFTLCFLLSHPKCRLCAVTLYPGSLTQVGLVHQTLTACDQVNIPIGSFNSKHPKTSVSPFHYKIFPKIGEVVPNGEACDVLYGAWKKYPDLVILTGGPPMNVAKLITKHSDVVLQKWVAQGGFAGDNIVPKEDRLSKFDGMEWCPAANFGSHAVVETLLHSDKLKQRWCVSKNVCHGVVYDKKMHEKIQKVQKGSKGLDLIYRGMDLYLQKNGAGKKFHDPLAAAVIFDAKVCDFVEVQLEFTKGKGWRSSLMKGTNTFISVKAHHDRFLDVLCTH